MLVLNGVMGLIWKTRINFSMSGIFQDVCIFWNRLNSIYDYFTTTEIQEKDRQCLQVQAELSGTDGANKTYFV